MAEASPQRSSGWLEDVAVGALSSGMAADTTVPELRSRWALRRSAVPTLPRGSTIVAAPAPGLPAQTWIVQRVGDLDPEVLDVVVEAEA